VAFQLVGSSADKAPDIKYDASREVRMVKATVSFIVVFVIAFVLGGWFLMPHLPPTPDHPVGVLEAEYWTTNWAGALLGIILGGLSARSAIKKKN
jgi:hypothetical protein